MGWAFARRLWVGICGLGIPYLGCLTIVRMILFDEAIMISNGMKRVLSSMPDCACVHVVACCCKHSMYTRMNYTVSKSAVATLCIHNYWSHARLIIGSTLTHVFNQSLATICISRNNETSREEVNKFMREQQQD